MSICNCSSDVSNFGQPNCVGILERPSKFAFVHAKADDGSSNAILSTDTLDSTFFSDKINDTDKSQRWFVTGEVNAVDTPRAENNTFELDGFNINSSKGVKTVAFTVADGASPELAAAYESMACRDMMFYSFSIAGQIGGNDRITDELNGFRIKKKTMKVIYQEPSKLNETPALIMVSFDLSETEKDENIAFINSGTGANDVQVDVLDLDGLIDIEMGAATSITVTSFTVAISLIYGTVFSKDAAEGFIITDFSYEEISPAPAPIVITSVTESSAGVYDFVVPIATSADVNRLTFSKTGFEAASTIDITIP